GRADSGGDLLAFDMGGTTAKLSLVDGGEPRTAYSFEAARQKRVIEGSGLPIRISTIELIEIGAGGGPIAPVDGTGLLKVGPRSAGSQPGPACYGLGGAEATVTDADLLLGYLNPDYFAGGTIAIDVDAARAALTRLAGTVSLPLISVAWGIHDIVNESMASAARVHIAERGRDPRDYALLCTGRAGPRLPRRAQARPEPGDLPAVGRRGLGARPARGARARRSRRDGRDPAGSRRSHGARDGVPYPRGRGARRHGRHRPQARDGAPPAARRRTLSRPGVRSGRRPARRSVRWPRRRRRAPRAHPGLRGSVSREVLAHAARRARRVHQHPGRRPGAGRGQRGRPPGP